MESNYMDATVIISTLIGAIIGTALGAFILAWRSESGLRKVRKTAIKTLDMFEKYEKQEKPYAEASAEFNSILNIAEKRSVLVALHKIGIPIAFPTIGQFDIKNVSFLHERIIKESVSDMSAQIKSGNCDKLFFLDIEDHFNDNLRIRTMRDIAIRFVNDVAKKTTLDESKERVFPDSWNKSFSAGQFNTIIVFARKIHDTSLYDSKGNPISSGFDAIIEDIKIGLWDKYLNTDELEYTNLQAQCNMAKLAVQNLSNSVPSQQNRCANFKPIVEVQ